MLLLIWMEILVFSIPVDSRALLFSYLGMKTQEVSANKSNYKIVMVEDATQMEEVVVIGYGSQSREKITTSVTKLDKEALKNVPMQMQLQPYKVQCLVYVCKVFQGNQVQNLVL